MTDTSAFQDAPPGPSDEGRQATERAFDASNAAEPGPDREISDEERDGVEATDTTAETPLGVGESISTRGEDHAETSEPGLETIGEKDGRPVGTSDERSATSIDPQGSGSDAPDAPPGG